MTNATPGRFGRRIRANWYIPIICGLTLAIIWRAWEWPLLPRKYEESINCQQQANSNNNGVVMPTIIFEGAIGKPGWNYMHKEFVEISGNTKHDIDTQLQSKLLSFTEQGYLVRDFIGVGLHNRMKDWVEIYGSEGITPSMFMDYWEPGGEGNPLPVPLLERIKRKIVSFLPHLQKPWCNGKPPA
jgi:hypothetical protein